MLFTYLKVWKGTPEGIYTGNMLIIGFAWKTIHGYLLLRTYLAVKVTELALWIQTFFFPFVIQKASSAAFDLFHFEVICVMTRFLKWGFWHQIYCASNSASRHVFQIIFIKPACWATVFSSIHLNSMLFDLHAIPLLNESSLGWKL